VNRNRLPPILLGPDLRRWRATRAAAVAFGLLAARIVNPDRPLPFDVCAFKVLTGIPCPTCGLTRSLCHALRGEWSASLGYHPAGIALALALIGWTIWSAAEAGRGELVADRVRRQLSSAMLTSGIAISVGVWLARLTA
jgi:Protein of unknown function (DUF2752)